MDLERGGDVVGSDSFIAAIEDSIRRTIHAGGGSVSEFIQHFPHLP